MRNQRLIWKSVSDPAASRIRPAGASLAGTQRSPQRRAAATAQSSEYPRRPLGPCCSLRGWLACLKPDLTTSVCLQLLREAEQREARCTANHLEVIVRGPLETRSVIFDRRHDFIFQLSDRKLRWCIQQSL